MQEVATVQRLLMLQHELRTVTARSEKVRLYNLGTKRALNVGSGINMCYRHDTARHVTDRIRHVMLPIGYGTSCYR
jgi:hypothetical protein